MRAFTRLSLLLVAVSLSGCGAGVTTVSEFCQVGATKLPVLLSRKDSLETKRQVADLNTTYQRLCLEKEPAK